MHDLYIVISLLILLVGVGLISWKIFRKPISADSSSIEDIRHQMDILKSDKRVAEEKTNWYIHQNTRLTEETEARNNRILELTNLLSARETAFTGLQEKLSEQKKELEAFQEKFRTEFRNLANEILEEKTQKFTEQNSIRLSEILKPLGEKIRDFEKKVEETYDKESKERFSLAREIKGLAELNQQISKEASNLTQALKGQTKTQGNWGEIILESILEKSGLVKNREYVVQPSFPQEHGKRLQPDVVVSYPGERHVVIDSKVSLTAYERFASAETKEEQDAALQDHLLSVKNHINELSAKNYQDLYQLRSLDFVMMFLPVEPAYMVAMQADPGIWNVAYEKRVLLISPTNLIAALRMIANLWRIENQNKNALEIARQSGDMLDKFTGFVNDMLDIGNRIDATQKSYDAAVNKLSTGKGNLIRRAEKIRELGAKTSKEIPQQLMDETTD